MREIVEVPGGQMLESGNGLFWMIKRRNASVSDVVWQPGNYRYEDARRYLAHAAERAASGADLSVTSIRPANERRPEHLSEFERQSMTRYQRLQEAYR